MAQGIGELLVGAKLINKTQLAATRPIQPFASRTPEVDPNLWTGSRRF
jgi:hypothetical protein